MGSERGSVTVMLLLIFCAMIVTTIIVVEAGRLKLAKQEAVSAADTALFSALTAYDQDMKDGYGLFFIYDSDGMKEDVADKLAKNLNIADSPEQWNPYGFSIESITVHGIYPMTDTSVIRHQIIEHMKYRGPKRLAGEVAVKLGFFLKAQARARVIKEELAADKKLKEVSDAYHRLQGALEEVNHCTDVDLEAVNKTGLQVSEELKTIMGLKAQLNSLDPAEYAAERAALINAIETKQLRIQTQIAPTCRQLEAVISANRLAIDCCNSLKKLVPELNQAIRQAEIVISEEEGVAKDVIKPAREKLEGYKKYADVGNLEELKRYLSSNITLLDRKYQALTQIQKTAANNVNVSAFYEIGYKRSEISSHENPLQQSVKEKGWNPPSLSSLAKLYQAVEEKIDALKRSVLVEDKGPILHCAEYSEPSGIGTGIEIDGTLESSTDGVLNLLSLMGERLPHEGLECLEKGLINVPKRTYEALLINEYALITFNNRSDSGRNKHALESTEMEYLLIGSDNPQVNASAVQLEITAWRTAFNIISFSCYCPGVINAIDKAAAALTVATRVPCTVWKGILTGLSATLESCADIKRMVEGESIPLYKNKIADTSMAKEITELMEAITAASDADDSPTESAEGGMSDNPVLTVDYEDHLRAMLLYRSLSGQTETILNRIQDLIYTNMSAQREGYNPQKHYNGVEAEIVLKIKSFFSGISGLENKPDNLPKGYRFTIESVRGY